ncbi:hypothetical protein Tco_0313504 [Tanacetum coccineum]
MLQLHFDDKLQFIEEPVKIMDREVKQLTRSRVPIVKVRWKSRRGPEFTWEREDQFRKKYPHLFTKVAPSSSEHDGNKIERSGYMSPPIRRKYRASVAFATGCRTINKIRWGNRKIRVPIAMWPCKVEEKMTLKEGTKRQKKSQWNDQGNATWCGEPLYGHLCRWCTCERCGNDLRDGYCFLCHSKNGDSFTYDSTSNSFDNPPDFSYPPPQPQYVPYSYELCGNDAHYGYDCPPQVPFVISLAWETISKIEHAFEDKQYQPEGILELFRKLHDDVQNIHEELAEYINTLTTESDEFIKSSAENLVPTPSESEDASDGECDLPVCDDFPKSHLVTFSNPLFDIDDDCTSSDDESFSEEDVPMENFKFFSNPLFDLDEEIISTEVNLIQNKVLESTTSIPPGIDSFDAESNLIESLLNQNTLIDSSSKIDSLLDEFAGELTLLKPIPPGFDDDNLDPEGEIHLSFSPSPIPVEDSDSLMEEIDVFLASDGSIPPGIESDDYDSEDDDNSTSLPEFESFHVDYPDSGDSTIDVVVDIHVDVPNILPTITPSYGIRFIPSP